MLSFLILSACHMPSEFCEIEPLPGATDDSLYDRLPNARSPYLSQQGSWNGYGGTIDTSDRNQYLDFEVELGLAWTFMPVHWAELEPDGAVDLSSSVPENWKALDEFVKEAHSRDLEIFGQIVVGGNAKGPPDWAGVREEGRSAPENMEALVNFAEKVADRYRPGGALAVQEGWDDWGILVWELDNEPNGYRTHWNQQEGDYAEYTVKASERLHALDPALRVIGPALLGDDGDWLEKSLDGSRGSDVYEQNGEKYGIGASVDVISFHNYEWLEGRAFSCTLDRFRGIIEDNENNSVAPYERHLRYWHTEGNYDFVPVTSAIRWANWRGQWFARGFSNGVEKLVVKDVTEREEVVVKTWTEHLPNPFPMRESSSEITTQKGSAVAYYHPDDEEGSGIWIVWSTEKSDAEVRIPLHNEQARVIWSFGEEDVLNAGETLELPGDKKWAPTAFIIDRKTE